ncbi:MAG TPA: hypothetical protein VGX23_10700 [Actinocrinis sp.]|nr:hypothetical protein [Actinocrinis sp.]
MTFLELVEQAMPGPLKDAVEHSRTGRGASALVAAESRMPALRNGFDTQASYTVEIAWALSQHAQILHRFGDPDLAVAAADLAVRTFMKRRDEINQTLIAKAGYVRPFVAAALVAADIHRRFGRADLVRDHRPRDPGPGPRLPGLARRAPAQLRRDRGRGPGREALRAVEGLPEPGGPSTARSASRLARSAPAS